MPSCAAQQAAEQPALALARNQIDIADKLGAALAPLQHDLAAMEGSSSARWATLTMVAFGNSVDQSSIILSWLFASSAEVASSSTMISGSCKRRRAKASRCFSPPDSVWSHGASSSICR